MANNQDEKEGNQNVKTTTLKLNKMKTQKTIKCTFCKKRKKIDDVYFLKEKSKVCICSDCNLELDIV